MAQDSDHGEALYTQFCATCHGAEAMGDGPLTDLLTTEVPDLHGLSARNDGVFPMLEVIHIIDGRTGVRAHGGPMPVYGDVFSRNGRGDMDYGSVLETRGKILSLAYYLESIQD
ncbi:c-type cytochrome [Roseivivax lentus]|nr:cytochrome c [Roseivivax lentus]